MITINGYAQFTFKPRKGVDIYNNSLEYAQHSGKLARILSEEDGMYEMEFPDGWCGWAYEKELDPIVPA